MIITWRVVAVYRKACSVKPFVYNSKLTIPIGDR